MNPEKQRIAIAEACGWRNLRLDGGLAIGVKPNYPDYPNPAEYRLPDYPNDLNAMHEAVRAGIKTENEFTDYAARLTVITGDFCPIEATAAQRAEAFLRAIGKWKES